jgi:SCP-2 sterol transfer family
MQDRTAAFFDELGRRGHEPLVGDVTATYRFDVASDHRTDSWRVEVSCGDIRVSRDDRSADCVICGSRAVFNRIVTGETTMFNALLRHEVEFHGDISLGGSIQRLMPGPPGAQDPRAFAGRGEPPA